MDATSEAQSDQGSSLELMIQQMIRQMSELVTRVLRVEMNGRVISEQPTNITEPTPTVTVTESTLPTLPLESMKRLKDLEPLNNLRSQYLLWQFQIAAKSRSELRRF